MGSIISKHLLAFRYLTLGGKFVINETPFCGSGFNLQILSANTILHYFYYCTEIGYSETTWESKEEITDILLPLLVKVVLYIPIYFIYSEKKRRNIKPVSQLQICLFGPFELTYGQYRLDSELSTKAKELCSYLVINRDCIHSREKLATLLWPENYPASNTKAYLRKALWQLQQRLYMKKDLERESFFHVTSEWIQFTGGNKFIIDIDVFKSAYDCTRGYQGRSLSAQQVNCIKNAVELYQGDLLENWYLDWCEFERDRLQNMYLIMLDKLLAHCITIKDVEEGFEYGTRSLKIDCARESTYRKLMQLYYLAGNRIKGLRIYEQCEEVLRDELDIEPSPETQKLCHKIRMGKVIRPVQSVFSVPNGEEISVRERLEKIRQLQEIHADIQWKIRQNINAVEKALKNSNV